MAFRDKLARKICWDSRDRYWACLDLPDRHRDACRELRRLYEASCPAHWVKHFDRKRRYIEFKEQIHSVGKMEAVPTQQPQCQQAAENSLSKVHRNYRQVVRAL